MENSPIFCPQHHPTPGLWTGHTVACPRARSSCTHVLELSERHELDDVSDGRLARRGAQTAPVTVEKLHGAEVGTAHPDDDDGHGQLGGINQSLSGLVEVRDHTVGDDEEHKILLPRKEGRPLSRCNSEQ